MTHKFRAWDKFNDQYWYQGDASLIEFFKKMDGFIKADNGIIFEQFVDKLDKNNKEIYDGDIFRVEEQEEVYCGNCDGVGWYEGGPTIRTECEACGGTGIESEKEFHYYLVVTWVKEWCMFCTLRVDEYHDYLESGIEALDEPMFWTYTLEDTDSRKFFLCGNIRQNQDLLNKQ